MKIHRLTFPVLFLVFLTFFTLVLSHGIDHHHHQEETANVKTNRVAYGSPAPSHSSIESGGDAGNFPPVVSPPSPPTMAEFWPNHIFNVLDFGAKGDGIKDDTKVRNPHTYYICAFKYEEIFEFILKLYVFTACVLIKLSLNYTHTNLWALFLTTYMCKLI